MEDNTITIRITTPPGVNTHRARIEGTNLSATCTASAELAAHAAAHKMWPGLKYSLRAVRGRRYTATLLEKRERGPDDWMDGADPVENSAALELAVGDLVRYQVAGMPEEREGTLIEILDLGWLVQDGQDKVMVRKTRDLIRKTPREGDTHSGVAVAAATRCSSLAHNAGAQEKALQILRRPELEVTLLPDRDACAPLIQACLTAERLGGLRAAALLAHVRQTAFPEKNQFRPFLDWGRERFGLADRSLCAYLAAGAFLLGPLAANLNEAQRGLVADCTVTKVEQLARLRPALLGPFLEKHAPAAMTREDLKEKIDSWLLTSEERKALAAKTAQTYAPAHQLELWSRDLEKLAAGDGPRRAEIVRTLDPGKALVGGISLAMLGVAADKKRHVLTKADLREALTFLETIRADLQTMADTEG